MQSSFVAVDPAADLAASLSRIGRHGDDLIERFEGGTLVRALRRGTVGRAYACTIVPGGLEVRVSDGLALEEAVEAVGAMVLDEQPALRRLAAEDPLVARLTDLYPGFRVVLDTD